MLTAKLKKGNKKDICEYDLDTGSDGSFMAIRMYKMLFLHTNINELEINRNSVVHP